MILHTGGSALGEISTKSNPISSAIFNAFDIGKIPDSMPSPTSLTSGAVINLLILCSASVFLLKLLFLLLIAIVLCFGYLIYLKLFIKLSISSLMMLMNCSIFILPKSSPPCLLTDTV